MNNLPTGYIEYEPVDVDMESFTLWYSDIKDDADPEIAELDRTTLANLMDDYIEWTVQNQVTEGDLL